MCPNRTARQIAGLLLALTLAGCGSGGGLTAPTVTPEPPPVIRTPTAYVITRITVLAFSQHAPDGGDWDWAILVEDRRPDISVSLKGRPVVPLYISDMRLNAAYNATHVFTRAASDADGRLPSTLGYGDAASVALVDDDPFGDTVMSSVSVRGGAMYRSDNAASLDHTLSGANGFRVRIQGSWVY